MAAYLRCEYEYLHTPPPPPSTQTHTQTSAGFMLTNGDEKVGPLCCDLSESHLRKPLLERMMILPKRRPPTSFKRPLSYHVMLSV